MIDSTRQGSQKRVERSLERKVSTDIEEEARRHWHAPVMREIPGRGTSGKYEGDIEGTPNPATQFGPS